MNLARAPRKGNEPTGVRLLSVFIICLMACCHTVAQPAMGRYRTDFSYSPADFADTIGIDWQGGQVYVPVTVNGKQYRFLLDTGASQAVVFFRQHQAVIRPLHSRKLLRDELICPRLHLRHLLFLLNDPLRNHLDLRIHPGL